MGHYNREELYEKVWTTPVRILAREYGVSDVAIAKACRKLHIPLPGRGYWNKMAAHRPVEPRPPLPVIKISAAKHRNQPGTQANNKTCLRGAPTGIPSSIGPLRPRGAVRKGVDPHDAESREGVWGVRRYTRQDLQRTPRSSSRRRLLEQKGCKSACRTSSSPPGHSNQVVAVKGVLNGHSPRLVPLASRIPALLTLQHVEGKGRNNARPSRRNQPGNLRSETGHTQSPASATGQRGQPTGL
jgi:hypothetical protein